jgi:hypothetical protein
MIDLYGDPIPEPEPEPEEKKKNYFFIFFEDITNTQTNAMRVLDVESEYNAYNMNRTLSQSADSLFDVNEMNGYPHLPNALQYDYFINSIRRRSRRPEKWLVDSFKSDNDLDVVKEYFNYSNQKAKDALLLLGDSELEYIKSKTYKGGKENDTRNDRGSPGPAR